MDSNQHNPYRPTGTVDPPRRSTLGLIAPLALLMCLLTLGVQAYIVAVLRPRYLKIFMDFGVELPASTQLFLAGSTSLWLLVLGTVALLLSSVGLVVRSGVRNSIYLASAFLLLLLVVASFLALRLPLMKLMAELS